MELDLSAQQKLLVVRKLPLAGISLQSCFNSLVLAQS
jgi:hypothetical protein